MAGDPARRRRRRDARRVRGQPAVPGRPSTRPCSATWKARRRASARPSAACSWPPRPAPAPARSTRGTTAPSRSPGSCRCSTWSWARSRPAASAPACTGCSIIGAILAVFIAGLMVGRTPEYLGKKVEALRDQDGDAHRPRPGRQHPRLHGHRERAARGHRRAAQHRPARLHRDPLRLLEPDRQQRLGLRGPDREHALLQRHRRRSRCSSAATG